MPVVDPLERLTNLVALLLEARAPLTMEQIADELAAWYPTGSSARRTAFERDKAVLRSEGVPISQTVLSGEDAGKTAYWIERSDYELDDLGLDDEERRALQLAVAAVHLERSWADEALWKLERPEDDAGASPLAVAASLPVHDALPALHQAVRDHAEVRFSYRGRQRRLEPYGLLARDGYWYVIGHDGDAGERRTYRLDRIEGGVTAGRAGSFERPVDFRADDAFPADPKQLDDGGATLSGTALVRIAPNRARSALAELGSAAESERRDDGSVVVSVPFANLPALRSWVLGFLDGAEVVGPPEVRSEMVRWLKAIAVDPSARAMHAGEA